TPPRRAVRGSVCRHEGDFWTIAYQDGAPFRLKDSVGMRCLSRLLERPGVDFLAIELVAASAEMAGRLHASGRPRRDPVDVAEELDGRTAAEYRRRLEDLRDQASQADERGDGHAAARLRAEMAAVAGELARGFGLGHRRRTDSHLERARVNVTKALKATI